MPLRRWIEQSLPLRSVAGARRIEATADTWLACVQDVAAGGKLFVTYLKDVITFRGRAGWAYENFLPYMFGGLAVGRMDVYRNVTSAVTRRDDVTSTDIFGVTSTTIGPTLPVPSVSQSLTQERTNNFVVGWTLGLGMEYMVWNCLFLRGEWEYIKFVQVMNTPIAMNSARLGIGYKF